MIPGDPPPDLLDPFLYVVAAVVGLAALVSLSEKGLI